MLLKPGEFNREHGMSKPVFDVQQVAYSYDEVKALDGLTLTIEQGKRIALLGANGSGKSTLLRLLDGLAFPDQGTISAFGEPLTKQSFEHADFAFSFHQRVGLIF